MDMSSVQQINILYIENTIDIVVYAFKVHIMEMTFFIELHADISCNKGSMHCHFFQRLDY